MLMAHKYAIFGAFIVAITLTLPGVMAVEYDSIERIETIQSEINTIPNDFHSYDYYPEQGVSVYYIEYDNETLITIEYVTEDTIYGCMNVTEEHTKKDVPYVVVYNDGSVSDGVIRFNKPTDVRCSTFIIDDIKSVHFGFGSTDIQVSRVTGDTYRCIDPPTCGTFFDATSIYPYAGSSSNNLWYIGEVFNISNATDIVSNATLWIKSYAGSGDDFEFTLFVANATSGCAMNHNYAQFHDAQIGYPIQNFTMNDFVYAPDTWYGFDITEEVEEVRLNGGECLVAGFMAYWPLVTGTNTTRWYGNSAGNYPYINMTFGAAADEEPPDPSWDASMAANLSYTNNESYIFYQVNSTENVGGCLLEVNGTNYTMSSSGDDCWLNRTGLTNQTTYAAFAYVNDTTGNLNTTTELWYTINLTSGAPCVENWTNTSWSAWVNTTCYPDNNQEQNRSRTEWDSNECNLTNTTHWDWQNITNGCDYCEPNWTGINDSVVEHGNSSFYIENGTCNASSVLDYQYWNWTNYNTTNEWFNDTEDCGEGSPPANITHFTNTSNYGPPYYSNITYNVPCSYTPPTPISGRSLTGRVIFIIGDRDQVTLGIIPW